MKRFLFAFLAFLSVPALAQDVVAVPGWRIIPEESSITFEAMQMGAAFQGEFKKFEGTIIFHPNRLDRSRARIAVDMTSIMTRNAERDGYIGTAEWFDTENFPQAIFETISIEKTGNKTYMANGTLAIRDVSLPVAVPFTLDMAMDGPMREAVMQGALTINRLDFGVGQGEWEDTKTVGNPVKIDISIKARPAAAL